jgi:hypothetical protein
MLQDFHTFFESSRRHCPSRARVITEVDQRATDGQQANGMPHRTDLHESVRDDDTIVPLPGVKDC